MTNLPAFDSQHWHASNIKLNKGCTLQGGLDSIRISQMQRTSQPPIVSDPWSKSVGQRGYMRETYLGPNQLLPEVPIFGWLRFHTTLPLSAKNPPTPARYRYRLKPGGRAVSGFPWASGVLRRQSACPAHAAMPCDIAGIRAPRPRRAADAHGFGLALTRDLTATN